MAATPIASFGPTAAIGFTAGTASANVALPTTGTPTIAVVANLGQQVAFVVLGNSSVAATTGTGMAILPNQAVALTIGANTNLAAVSLAGAVGLNVTVGN